MPLRKEKVSILFSQGIHTEVDHKILPKEALTVLENARFDKIGALNKRTGYSLIDKESSDLVTHKDALIARNVITGDRSSGTLNNGAVYASGSGEFVGDVGYSDGIDYTSIPVSKGSEYRQEDSNVEISSDGKYACITFVDVSWDHTNDKKQYTKRFSIVDRENNSLIASDVKLGTAVYSGNKGRRMRPVWLSTPEKFYIFGEDELAFKVWVINPSATTIEPLNASTGVADVAGLELFGKADYPLSVTTDHVTGGASFDVCSSSNGAKANLLVTVYSSVSSSNFVSYYEYTTPNTLTSRWADAQGTLVAITGAVDPIASISITSSEATGTAFLSEVFVGDRIKINAETRVVMEVTANDALKVTSAFSNTGSDSSLEKIKHITGHIAIHRATVTGTHANKLSFMYHDGTDIKFATCAESATSTTSIAIGGSANTMIGVFKNSVNPLYSSDQDVQWISQSGQSGTNGNPFRLIHMDGIHDNITDSVLNFKFISWKKRLAFALGDGPISIGTFNDVDAPVATSGTDSDSSEAPVSTIGIWDLDTESNANAYSAGVSNNATSATNMFNADTAATFLGNPTTSVVDAILTITFEPPIVFSTNIKFYHDAITGGKWRCDNHGGTLTALTSALATTETFTNSGVLSKLEFQGNDSTDTAISIRSITIDNKFVIDTINPPWRRDYLPAGTFKPEWISDVIKSSSYSGATTSLKGEAVAIPVGHSFERFGTAGDIALNSTVRLFDFRRYNEERADIPAPSTATLFDVLYVADNGLSQYDGRKFHIPGFLERPMFGAAITAGGSTLEAGAIYFYKVVYEWVDAQGNLHESEPSEAVAVTVGGGGGSRKVTLTVAYVDIGSYSTIAGRELGYRDDIKAAIYRTSGGGIIYNNITTVACTAKQNETGFVTFVDDIHDDVAATGKFLYTQSGELSNTPPPAPARYVVAHRDRLFVIGKDDVVYFSKIAKDGYGIGFSSALSIRTPNNIEDPPTALGSMDGNLFIFTKRSIYIISGEGPDNSGIGGFYDTKKVPSSVGAIKGSPVKLTNDGLFFVSATGIYLLGRNMAVTNVGSPVETLLSGYTVRDIVINDSQESVFFLLSGGTADDGTKVLTYNYQYKQWAIDGIGGTDDAGAGSSMVYSGDSLHIGSKTSAGDARVYKEQSSYDDAGNYIPMKLKTGWINLAGIQSYQRIYSFHILGESIDKHTLTVNVYYDYDTSSATNTYTFSTSSATDAKLQFRGHLSKQKCQAIQFEIVDADNSGSTDEGFTISEIALEVGIKQDQYKNGNAKLGSTVTIGSN